MESTMHTSRTLDLEALIESARLSRFQIVIIALCAMVAMVDGFDTQSIALVASEIASAWGVQSASFGPVFGAGLFGSLVGALIFGVVGDQFGRKPCLLLAVSIFTAASVVTPFTNSIAGLIAVR